MRRLEEAADNLESDPLINIPVEPKDIEVMPEEEQAEWIEGIQEELDNLDDMQVMDRVDKKAMPEAAQRPIPAKLVLVKKPLTKPNHRGKLYKCKARVVASGNKQTDSQKALRNRREVPGAFFVRCVLALALLHGLALSILGVNAAFLYADLPAGEPPICVAPPNIFWSNRKCGSSRKPSTA